MVRNKVSYEVTASMAERDLSARRALARWGELAERGRQISLEPEVLDGFQLEPTDPTKVGLSELLSDEFSPEELVHMFNRPPLIFDWDKHQSTAAV